jgi:hypothetical protein
VLTVDYIFAISLHPLAPYLLLYLPLLYLLLLYLPLLYLLLLYLQVQLPSFNL